ncbi:MAG: molybdopterin-guanine dinucleotide biosynthesis protein B [Deltaproteobacteria bacterium]|nr:molybdopterin-guanine dinucleotide biosynthesis protein B [Deltaproteobacteria bacterium]
MPVLSFVGRSGSGKTTFLEKLIPLLVTRGCRVGALKHAHHMVEIDKPGKDSYRLREAGAVEVVASAPNMLALIRTEEADLPLREALSYFRKSDLVLIEGYKGEDLPHIEIFRQNAGHDALLFQTGPPPSALITDADFPGIHCPVFALDDYEGVAEWMVRVFLRNRRP